MSKYKYHNNYKKQTNIKISGRNGETIDETGLEIELDDIWYDVPLQENVMVTLTKSTSPPLQIETLKLLVGYPAWFPDTCKFSVDI